MCNYSYESQFSHLAPQKSFYLHFYALTSSRAEYAVGEPSPVGLGPGRGEVVVVDSSGACQHGRSEWKVKEQAMEAEPHGGYQ